jgi:hypothetical protein
MLLKGDAFKEADVKGLTKYDDVWLDARDGFARALLGPERGGGRMPLRYYGTLRALTFRLFEGASRTLQRNIPNVERKEQQLQKALRGESVAKNFALRSDRSCRCYPVTVIDRAAYGDPNLRPGPSITAGNGDHGGGRARAVAQKTRLADGGSWEETGERKK